VAARIDVKLLQQYPEIRELREDAGDRSTGREPERTLVFDGDATQTIDVAK
jgi:hypothetical protein